MNMSIVRRGHSSQEKWYFVDLILFNSCAHYQLQGAAMTKRNQWRPILILSPFRG